jgi:hypothetical protein
MRTTTTPLDNRSFHISACVANGVKQRRCPVVAGAIPPRPGARSGDAALRGARRFRVVAET